jgi:lysophospholipase L1-like esterase
MFKLITLVFCLLAASSCKDRDVYTVGGPGNPNTGNPPADTTTKRILALGDSYTIGQSVPDSDRFAHQLVAMLAKDSIRFFQPEIIAQTGWTTGNLLSRLNAQPPQRSTYNIVTLLIGVNNQYQGRSQAEYRTEFGVLLQRAIQYADNIKRRVLVLSIPDWGVTPFANGQDRQRIARQIDSFNLINRDIAVQQGVQYLEITNSTREAATDLSLLTFDNLHYSRKEYGKWATRLVPLVKDALR